MLRALAATVRDRLGSEGAESDAEETAGGDGETAAEDDSEPFLCSRLDASVFQAHGGSVASEPVDRDVQEQGDELAAEQRAAQDR